MKKRIKILWMSYNAPVKADSQAGSQSFHYYFSKFIEDRRFAVRLVSCGKEALREETEKELSEVKHFVRYLPFSRFARLKNPVNWESTFNICFHKQANMIQNSEKIYFLQCARFLKEKGFEPDVIILEWTNVVVLVPELKKIFPECRMIASEHDVAFIGFKRNAEHFKGLNRFRWKIRYAREKKVEANALKRCDLIVPYNYDNRKELAGEGIDCSKIQKFVPYFHNMEKCIRRPNGKDILFFGDMSRGENETSAVWFIEKVMPLLEDLNVRFVVIGNQPSERLLKLAGKRICITGFVDSVTPYFEECMCFAAPMLLGAGIKVKVLEALSSGIPVLTNHIGIEGIPAKPGRDYFKCESPDDYSSVIRRIVYGETDCDALCVNAKLLIKEKFVLRESVKSYKEKIISLANKS